MNVFVFFVLLLAHTLFLIKLLVTNLDVSDKKVILTIFLNIALAVSICCVNPNKVWWYFGALDLTFVSLYIVCKILGKPIKTRAIEVIERSGIDVKFKMQWRFQSLGYYAPKNNEIGVGILDAYFEFSKNPVGYKCVEDQVEVTVAHELGHKLDTELDAREEMYREEVRKTRKEASNKSEEEIAKMIEEAEKLKLEKEKVAWERAFELINPTIDQKVVKQDMEKCINTYRLKKEEIMEIARIMKKRSS